jgi:L-aspartate oxidase
MSFLEETVDFLVIGSGIAGLSFALRAAKHGRVAVVTKKERAESNTNYAQGGIAAVLSENDSFELHIRDTLQAGAGLCHPNAVEIMVREGPECVRELEEWGVQFTKQRTEKGEFYELGREGGHSRNRIVHAQDLTGREVERALVTAVREHPNVSVHEDHVAIDLITEHHLGREAEARAERIHCYGAYVLDVREGIVKKFLAPVTLLATGGCGQIYRHTTNPEIATGDGVAMAYRAGAAIANMEFMQFHPTAFYTPTGTPFLISEAVRGFGGVLRTRDGHEFMSRYHPMGSLAPRDVVARAIDAELKRRGEECVYLDVTHLPAEKVKERFPNIYESCLRYGIDMTKEPVPVVPAAHYSCGGVVTDLRGRTTIAGLYACGEVACTGVHGANRLASNSLLEAVAFSKRAYHDAAQSLRRTRRLLPEIPAWDDTGTFNSEEWVLISHDRQEIQSLMWDYVGIVRSRLRLQRARRRIGLIRREVEDFYRRTRVTEGLLELRNMAQVASLVVDCALYRKESRGLHYNTDYPTRDDEHWLRDTILVRSRRSGVRFLRKAAIQWEDDEEPFLWGL